MPNSAVTNDGLPGRKTCNRRMSVTRRQRAVGARAAPRSGPCCKSESEDDTLAGSDLSAIPGRFTEASAGSGYGFSVLGGRAVAVPRAGWSRSGESETLRHGQSLLLGSSEWRLESEFTEDSRVLRVGYGYSLRMSVDLSVEASRREPANDGAPEYGLMLRGGLRW